MSYIVAKESAMSARDRRLGFRVPLEIFLNEYIKDQPFRALTSNVSDTGVHLHRVMNPVGPELDGQVVGLEFELPGTGEVIWARGEICHDREDRMVRAAGVRFTGMARAHARLLRDYCIESRRRRLGRMLERIRHPDHAVRAMIG
jgi:c-di-GMP-binding flagellar brake protein YcgR